MPLVGFGREADDHADVPAGTRVIASRRRSASGSSGRDAIRQRPRRSTAGRGGRGRSASAGMNCAEPAGRPPSGWQVGRRPGRPGRRARAPPGLRRPRRPWRWRRTSARPGARARSRRDLDHELADRDRVQVEIAQQPAVVADGGRRQLGPHRHRICGPARAPGPSSRSPPRHGAATDSGPAIRSAHRRPLDALGIRQRGQLARVGEEARTPGLAGNGRLERPSNSGGRPDRGTQGEGRPDGAEQARGAIRRPPRSRRPVPGTNRPARAAEDPARPGLDPEVDALGRRAHRLEEPDRRR